MTIYNSAFSENSVVDCILVVDDEPALRLFMCKQLEKLGYAVDLAQDGTDALSYFEDKNYRLVFMDIRMNYMNGLLATVAMRGYELDSNRTPTPIIATTSGDASRSLCLTVGMSDCLEKPVYLSDLQNMLEKWIGSDATELVV